jgi:hypothetical protein
MKLLIFELLSRDAVTAEVTVYSEFGTLVFYVSIYSL